MFPSENNTFNLQQHVGIDSFSFQPQSSQQKLPIYTSLDQIYPDIDGQLCSKQSTLFGRLKNSFSATYDGLCPDKYIVLNHVGQLSLSHKKNPEGDMTTKSMIAAEFALQNGLIFMVKSTYKGQNIFINCCEGLFASSNGLEEPQETILTCQGKPTTSNPTTKSSILSNQQLQSIVESANDSLSLNKLFGGVIYIYSSIDCNVKHFKEKLKLGLYLSVLEINNLLGQVSIDDMKKVLCEQGGLFEKEKEFLDKQLMGLGLQHRQMKMIKEIKDCPQSTNIVKLPKNKKLLFYNLLMMKQQLQQLQKQQKQNQSQSSLTVVKDNADNYQNSIQDLFQFDLQSKLQQTQYTKYVKKVVTDLKLKNYALMKMNHSSNYLISLVGSSQCHQTLRRMRKYFSEQSQQPNTIASMSSVGELSQQNPEQQPQKLQKRFGKIANIDQCMFSCACAIPLAILNPQSQMWFN